MVTRRCRSVCFGALAIALALAADASGDSATDLADRTALVGEYRHSALSATGKTRRSVAVISPRGAGLSVMWEEDEGNLFGGIGVSLDGVFGAAYTEALDGSFRGQGVLAYHIDGGTLDGIRLPYDSADGALIQETLEGSATLQGRFAIARSLDAGGHTYHSGYVEIERQGDTYQMTWYTPARSSEGVGIRIGDVLIAGYANGFAPGVIAYCADKGLLTGIATFGHVGTVGMDSMTRVSNGGTGADSEPSARCRAAISKWNRTLAGG